jgi:hypothetical protein
MENANEPINPCEIQGKQGFADRPTIPNREVYGLTKREYFAGLAMQGWISCQHDGFTGDEFSIATRAVRCADALLAELENKKK